MLPRKEEEILEEVKPKRKSKATDTYKEKEKEFLVRNKSGTSLYEVYFEKGGEIPKTLNGLYTSQASAKKAIKLYEVTRRQFY